MALDLVGRTTIRSLATATGRGLEPLDIRTDPQIRLNDLVGWLLVVKTKKKSFIFINIFFLKFRFKKIQQENNSNLE